MKLMSSKFVKNTGVGGLAAALAARDRAGVCAKQRVNTRRYAMTMRMVLIKFLLCNLGCIYKLVSKEFSRKRKEKSITQTGEMWYPNE